MLSKEKIIMVKKTTCQVKLQNHEWMISFTYHGKEECFYLCKEELLKECDEQIKMCNTMSFIGGCDTIAQYKIKKWVNENFVSGSVFIEFTDSNKATITDTSGATMNLSYTQMKGVHEDVPEK